MAKRHSLVDASTPMPLKKPCITDWRFCVLYQKNTRTDLEYPARSSKAPIGSGYKSLAEHLIQFQMHDCMPLDKRLDDGDEAMMMRHHTCWHKACRVKLNQTKLERLEKDLQI